MPDLRRRGRWTFRHIAGLERGDTFDDWVTLVSDTGGSSGKFERKQISDFFAYLMHWQNDSGGATGTAYYHQNVDIDHSGNDGKHLVSIRVPETNATNDIPVGPATCLHGATGALHNGYCLQAASSGITVGKISSGSITWHTSSAVTVVPGDVISIGYEWKGTSAAITAWRNGTQLFEWEDTSSPYFMQSVGGYPGLAGYPSRAHGGSSTIGTILHEWWVNKGFNYHEPQVRDYARCGHVSVMLKTFQRFTDSDDSVVKRLFVGSLTKCQWDFDRKGGCGLGVFKAKFAEEYEDLATMFNVPPHDDWNDGEWCGGTIEVLVRNDNRDMLEIGTSAEIWRIYMGRIKTLEYDYETKEISINAEGLGASLREHYITKKYDEWKVQDIVDDLVGRVVKTNEAGDQDTYILGSNVSVAPGMLEQSVSLSFENETIASALDRVLATVPEKLVWGVDRNGMFYLYPQISLQENDSSGIHLLSLNVATDALRWRKKINFKNLKTKVVCSGQKHEVTGKRILGEAFWQRGRSLYGLREKVVSTSDVSDDGIAAKIAQAHAKKAAEMGISGSLLWSGHLGRGRSLYASLVPYAATYSISDYDERLDMTDENIPGSIHHPYSSRRFGDVDPWVVTGNGQNGEYAELDFEEHLDKAWMVHVSLKFTTAHNATYLEQIFGAYDSSASSGFCRLYWATSGTLYFQVKLGTTGLYAMDTGITVNAASPADTVVNFTALRDSIGNFYFFNGNTQTGSDTTKASEVMDNTSGRKWRFFIDRTASPNNYGWRGQWERFWFFDGSEEGGIEDIDSPPATAYTNFIARIQGKRLHRFLCNGLRLYIPGNDYWGSSSPYTIKAWRRGHRRPMDTATIESVTLSVASPGTNTGWGTGHRLGSRLGSEQRWGGPLQLDAERIRYNIFPADRQVKVDIELGEKESVFQQAVAMIQLENDEQNALLRKLRERE